MQVIPVLDLRHGLVVHGVAGRRDEYRPIVTPLSPSSAPLDVARGLRESLGLSLLYVADLDGILDSRPNLEVCRSLDNDGFHVMVDVGVRSLPDIQQLLAAGARQAIVGLETWPDPKLLGEACRQFGAGRIVFSLDLKGGRPMLPDSGRRSIGWLDGEDEPDALAIAARAVGAGVTRIIVLDVAHVGVSQGVSTLDLCRAIRSRWPVVELITGGGVRSSEDLRSLAVTGVEGALVATALHSGRIGREHLAEFQ